ncbi:MAG: tail fiber protein [Myxococcales bacterium]|nr:tail fiber protein [Myxococcales bacterium]MCB9566026.1 tail fiber protein [Myxococcales bacterium]MCB9702792.1 tail fiber protein [Myxococcales bacterium]
MEGYIGEIRLFGGTFAPLNWSFCDGQLLQPSQYPALFSILGNSYGGDGRTNFALPKLASVSESDGGPVPVRYIICVNGNYPQRP